MQQPYAKMKQNIKKSRNVLGKGQTFIGLTDIPNPVSVISVRKGLNYMNETVPARYYETFYHYPAHIKREYGSKNIRGDLNFIWENDIVKRILSLYIMD